MLGVLPQHIEPVRLAELGRRLSGSLPLSAMPRLKPLLLTPDGSVQVELAFGTDERRIRALRGRIHGTLQLRCERCLEAMDLAVDIELSLGIVTNEAEAERLPEEYEPLLVGEEPVSVSDIVEDELILSLPAVPMHSDERQCHAPQAGTSEQVTPDYPAESERANPFAVLAGLKSKH